MSDPGTIIPINEKGGKTQTSSSTGIVSTLTTSFGSIASDVMDAISAILPIALPILGTGIAIVLGIKYFKKVTNK